MAFQGINLDIYLLCFRTIVAHTLTAESPNLSNVIIRLNAQSQYELLLARKNSSMNTFLKNWQEWLSNPRASNYLKNCEL